jgi:aminopeptidase N
MRQLTDSQRISLLTDPDAEVDPDWLTIYGEILMNGDLAAGLKAYFLRIDEQPLDRNYITWYLELVHVREKLMAAVNRTYRKELVDAFFSLNTYGPRKSPKDGIEDRILKYLLVDLIACDDRPESHQIVLDYYRSATTAQDRVSALTVLNRSSSPERRPLLEEVYLAWHSHISGYANYLRIVSSGSCDDVFDMIEEEKNRPSFQIANPTWCRALLLTVAANTKMIWTDEGVEWIVATIIEIARLNPFVTSKLLNVFQHARKLRPNLKPKAVAALQKIIEEVPESVNPAVNGQAKAYLG